MLNIEDVGRTGAIIDELCCHEEFYVLLGRILARATDQFPKKRSSVAIEVAARVPLAP